MTDDIRIELCDGKYTYCLEDGEQFALRNGEEWRDLAGDKFVLSMAHEICDLKEKLAELTETPEVEPTPILKPDIKSKEWRMARAAACTIEFTIGDWSEDGHGGCDTVLISSNHPVERLREAHFNARTVLGFDIGDICSEYQNNEISESICKQLTTLNIKFEKEPDVQELIDLWARLLMVIDPGLNLVPKTMDETPRHPSMHFYGFDEVKRHLRVPGYGLFHP